MDQVFPHADLVGQSPDDVLGAFLEWVVDKKGIEPYPAQEEALLELYGGQHIILNTTGSGKSLVALGLHVLGLTAQKRSYYTAPIKALVSEKFFDLCNTLGAEHVGMITGDGSINSQAPVICCTAEILANIALRQGGQEHQEALVVMDEFHYYGDRDRGVAWQIPLLEMPKAQFLLMSATLGDMSALVQDLEEKSKRSVAWVKSSQRPVPLDYEYSERPLHETLDTLLKAQKAPIYLVNFSQKEAAEQAQALTSLNLLSKEEKQQLKQEMGGFRFDTPAGKDLRRLLHAGVGLHHAGLLPKYRRLFERLAQSGLLKVISGTDTLGVGVNIPIRTVLFTKLYKFDGQQNGVLSVRDFKQIAGRAGRKGFDAAGSVVAQAPAHMIANRIAAQKAAAKGSKKAAKTSPPKGFINYSQEVFQRLIDSEPEALKSSFKVSQSMIDQVLFAGSTADNKYGDYRRLLAIIERSHESPRMKERHHEHANALIQSMLDAKILQADKAPEEPEFYDFLYRNPDLQRELALNQDLSIFLLDALFYLDRGDDNYALNVLSMVEAIQENPIRILRQQVDRLKKEKLAELKSAGVDYEDRIKQLDEIDWPKPLESMLYELFDEFREKHLWARNFNVRPKSITREIIEEFLTFNDTVKRYGLSKMEGMLLRYLTETYRLLVQNIPDDYRNEELDEIALVLKTMLERTDSSLLKEWEALQSEETDDDTSEATPHWGHQLGRSSAEIDKQLRRELFQFSRTLAQGDYLEASIMLSQPEGYDPAAEPQRRSGVEGAWSALDLQLALKPVAEELISDARLRLSEHARILRQDGIITAEQSLLDQDAEALGTLSLVYTPRQDSNPESIPGLHLQGITLV